MLKSARGMDSTGTTKFPPLGFTSDNMKAYAMVQTNESASEASLPITMERFEDDPEVAASLHFSNVVRARWRKETKS